MAIVRNLIATLVAAGVASICSIALAQGAAPSTGAHVKKSSASVERGRYLVRIAACNDCHTSGYLLSDGNVAEDQWLTGDSLGWRGPWGTTYATNLRDKMPKMTEAQWLKYAKTVELRPPMPWFTFRHMTDADLRAIYRFVVYLGPGGKPAPDYVPPDQEPKPPYVTFPAPPK
jgi:mono/diheme cytochrome c family protein